MPVKPVSVSAPDGPEALAFLELAKKVAAALETASSRAPKHHYRVSVT